ncbi:MAG: hypothetical protein QXP71_06835 [Desulfurococcaceae archaeon]
MLKVNNVKTYQYSSIAVVEDIDKVIVVEDIDKVIEALILEMPLLLDIYSSMRKDPKNIIRKNYTI